MDETEQRRVDTQETIRQFTHKRDLDLQRDFSEVDNKERHYTKFYTSNNGIYRSQFMNVPLYDEDSMRLADFVHANRITTPETGGYIIAQSPLMKPEPQRMDTTLSWYRMIWSSDVRVIVSLVHLGHEENCAYYFPNTEKGVLKIGDFKIITEDKHTQLDWNWTYFRLRVVQKAEKKEIERKLIVIVCKNWTDDPATNKLNYRNLVDLLDFVWTVEADVLRQWKEQKGSLDVQSRPPPTLVHSRAGMNRAGCYIAASICGKMMKQPGSSPHSYNLRRIIAICRRMRHVRYDVFCSRTMFVLLLETLLEIAAKLGLVDRERTAKARRVLIKACMNIHGSSRQPLRAPDPTNRSRRFGGSSTSRTTTTSDE